MRYVVQLCLAANNILLMRKQNHAFILLYIFLMWNMASGYVLAFNFSCFLFIFKVFSSMH